MHSPKLPIERPVETLIQLNPAVNLLQGTESAPSPPENIRGQPREMGSSSKLPACLGSATQYISVGGAHNPQGVQTLVWVSPTKVQWHSNYSDGPRAGAGYGAGSTISFGEGGHRPYFSP